jgi:hypothetical protein
MTLSSECFEVHDISAFPLIRFRSEQAGTGYALQWQHEMEALLAHGAPFAILYAGARGEEAQEDRKRRAIWLKQNRTALARLCRGLASVEPDAARRQALQQMVEGAMRAFGVKQTVAATEAQALDTLLQDLRDHDAGDIGTRQI